MILFGGVSSGSGGTGLTDVDWGNHVYVDQVLGDDTTALRESLVYKFKTLDAAVAAAIAGDVVWIINGNHAPAAGIWQAKGITIYCEQGVSISGTELNIDIVAGCNLLGYGIINDTSNFIESTTGLGKIVLQAYEFNLQRIALQGADELIIHSWTNITMTQYIQHYNGEYKVYYYANEIRFTNPTVAAGLSCFIVNSIPDSVCHVFADLVVNGTNYVRCLDLIGEIGIFQVDFRMKRNIYVNGLLTECVIRSYNTYLFSTDLASNQYNLSFDGDVVCSISQYRLVFCVAGYIKLTGCRLNSDNTAAPIISVDGDLIGLNQPSTILLDDVKIYAKGDGGLWANGIIFCFDNGLNLVIIDRLKIVSVPGNVNVGVDSNIGPTFYRIQGQQFSNVAAGGNMTNVILGTSWNNDANVTW